jgi:hypothetical protein
MIPPTFDYVAPKTLSDTVAALGQNESNLTQEQMARLKYPAGLDFGAVTPEEVALSILAEMIQRRRQSPVSNSLISRSSSLWSRHRTCVRCRCTLAMAPWRHSARRGYPTIGSR